MDIYEKFIKEYNSTFWNIPLETTVDEAIMNWKKIWSGTEKIIYLFPKMPNYVIAYFYKKEKKDWNFKFQKCDLKFPKYSFSQAFLSNNYDIEIKEFIAWIPNSVDDYISIIKYVCENDSVTREISIEFLEKIRLFEDFPQASFDKFAKQIEYLRDNWQFIDCANPNNVLIDTNKQEFNLIDLFTQEFQDAHKEIIDKKYIEEWASVHDMICILLDSKFQAYYLEKLDDLEREEVIKISKSVIDKCIKAAEKTTLSKSDVLMKTIHSLIPHWHHIFNENCYRRYTEFVQLYDNELSKLNIIN